MQKNKIKLGHLSTQKFVNFSFDNMGQKFGTEFLKTATKKTPKQTKNMMKYNM